jgi:hypothetical protein
MGRAVKKEIPDTSIFDLRLSREEKYFEKFGLNERERHLIRSRDFKGLIEAGTNIYALLKIGSATGNSLYRMGAQMRGETYEQFLATRNFKDAV